MADASFNTFFNKPFGLNVKNPESPFRKAGEAVANQARSGILEPLNNFFEDNEGVFDGSVQDEMNRIFAHSFNVGAKMQAEDRRVNGAPPKFDSKF